MMENAYEVVNMLDLWIWLKNYEIPHDQKCIFYDNEQTPILLNEIIDTVNKQKIIDCNVEYSTIHIITDLQYIANNGLQHYKERVVHMSY